MFTALRNTIKNGMTRKMVLLAATAASIVSFAPMSAQAHERDRVGFEIHINDRPRRWVPAVCEERVTQVWVEPSYRTVCDQVYERPVYRTVVERVWREAVVKTVVERVWVPDRYEYREQVCYDGPVTYIRRERVLVCAGHEERVEHRVVICDGHYETVEHQVQISEGRYRQVERTELVTPGHYSTRTERVEVVAGHWESMDPIGFDLRIGN